MITVSVLLNLLLLGMTFGYTGKSLLGCRVDHLNAQELVAVWPEAKRHDFEPRIAQFEHDKKQLEDQLVEERAKAAGLIKATPFNREAYMAKIKTIQDLRVLFIQKMAGLIADIADKSTDSERAKLADVITQKQKQLHGR